MADGYLCRACSKVVGATQNDRYRTHKDGAGGKCETSSEPIPDDLLRQEPSDTKKAGVPEEGKDFAKCPQCGRGVKLTRLGYFPPHDTTLRGGERCSTTGVRAFHAGGVKDTPLPGDTVPEEGVDRALRPKVSNQMEVELEAAPVATPAPLPDPAGATSSEGAPPDGPPTEEEALEALKTFEEPARSNLIQQPMALTEELLAQWSDVEALRKAASAPEAVTSGASTETSSPESAITSAPSPEPTLGPFPLGPTYSSRISQPVSLILQPPPYSPPEKPEPMGDLAKELATRIKETFYAYDNRKSSDNRSAQTTLGPSEIGTPCDRRLAMALIGVPPVNPGGDGWAAFVGTCGHVGMGEVYKFADAGTGRYAVEMPVRTGSDVVPRGTTDLLDRMIATIVDWKFMGAYSLKKFKQEGPSDTYRIQAHVYGYAAVQGGERVKNVAIVGLPRAGGSLDEMHVWTEKYDRKVAEAALARAEGIAEQVELSHTHAGLDPQELVMTAAKRFDTANDCRYCPFYLKGDKEMRRGCPGV